MTSVQTALKEGRPFHLRVFDVVQIGLLSFVEKVDQTHAVVIRMMSVFPRTSQVFSNATNDYVAA